MQVQSDLAAALDQLAEMARARHPDDDVLAEFLPRYYHDHDFVEYLREPCLSRAGEPGGPVPGG